MRWIQAFLTLVVLLIGFALNKAEAVEERPSRIDGAPADASCVVIHAGVAGADSHREATSSVDLSVAFDSLIQAPPLLADTPSVGPWPSLESPVPARHFLVETPPVAVSRQRRCPTDWPATAVGRLTWLQRFLF
jgi:hypothetical protein